MVEGKDFNKFKLIYIRQKMTKLEKNILSLKKMYPFLAVLNKGVKKGGKHKTDHRAL